jgi:hypothetical protein
MFLSSLAATPTHMFLSSLAATPTHMFLSSLAAQLSLICSHHCPPSEYVFMPQSKTIRNRDMFENIYSILYITSCDIQILLISPLHILHILHILHQTNMEKLSCQLPLVSKPGSPSKSYKY